MPGPVADRAVPNVLAARLYILRVEVMHAAHSSDDTSQRIKRAQRGVSRAGPHDRGRPGLGVSRRDVAWTPGPGVSEQDRPNGAAERVEAERRALRDSIDDLLSGSRCIGSVAHVLERGRCFNSATWACNAATRPAGPAVTVA
jgi:hypothetical protein